LNTLRGLKWYVYCYTTDMRRYLLLLFITAYAATCTAQESPLTQDTAYNVQLKEVQVKARWLNDTDRYNYNQTKYYVTIVLPYVIAATKMFNEISAVDNDAAISRKERRRFINSKQEEIRTKFEDKLRTLNTTQGHLLVKLVARQTDLNIYKMLLEFKDPFTAIKWQTVARFNGLDLNKRYRPEEEPVLENIMDELGYPLPAVYAANSN